MFDSATLTIAGNVVADPRITGRPDEPERVNFRVVSTRRRRDPQSGEWVDAGEYGVNVVCWRHLARGVANSLHRGDPVLVTGRIAERAFQGDDGNRRYYTEVTADFVGHDLSKGTAQFYRFSRLNRLTQSDRADGAGAPEGSEASPTGDGFDGPSGFAEPGVVDGSEELPEPEFSGV